jgi:glycosyltransferase involved in cell wall biosynthesis
MVILSNFKSFPTQWMTSAGIGGNSELASTAKDYVRLARENKDAVAIVNCNPVLTLDVAARFMALARRPPLVAVDLVLRRPRAVTSLMMHPIKRALLSQVDFFVHYFRDVSGYQKVFGIGADRSTFVRFKVNLFGQPRQASQSDGEYVLCLGRTLRDFDTFFAAMERLPCMGAIPTPDFNELRLHGSRFSRSLADLPKNVRILEDDGTSRGMLSLLEGAMVVAVPILKESMAASGCGITLNAMSLGKCVVGTAGPGFSDVFQNGEVICVPPEDPAALARAIGQVWDDDALRARVAQAGYRYAVAAGGEQDLFQRIIEQVVSWYQTRYFPCHRARRAQEN